MEMGDRIREQRIAKNLTMEQLADMLGVGKSAVNKWEKGYVKQIKRPTIKRLAEIFNCSPAWLMGFDDADHTEEQPIHHMQLSDEEYNYILNRRKEANDKINKELNEAIELYEWYKNANHDTQKAIELLLKPQESKEQ